MLVDCIGSVGMFTTISLPSRLVLVRMILLSFHHHPNHLKSTQVCVRDRMLISMARLIFLELYFMAVLCVF